MIALGVAVVILYYFPLRYLILAWGMYCNALFPAMYLIYSLTLTPPPSMMEYGRRGYGILEFSNDLAAGLLVKVGVS